MFPSFWGFHFFPKPPFSWGGISPIRLSHKSMPFTPHITMRIPDEECRTPCKLDWVKRVLGKLHRNCSVLFWESIYSTTVKWAIATIWCFHLSFYTPSPLNKIVSKTLCLNILELINKRLEIKLVISINLYKINKH